MVEETIRLRYAGFILFASRLVSAATGIAFVLMVTRSTSAEEFGVWGNLGDVLGYFTLVAGMLPFWATRFTARKYTGSAKTGFLANLLMSTIIASLYLALVPTITSALHISGNFTILYAIASIQIVESYTLSALEAVLYAKQPQMIGYGLLISEISKVAVGFVFITQLKLGLIGVIWSLIIACILQLTFYLKLTTNELKEAIEWTYLKEWLKASPINLYNIAGGGITTFVFIFLFVYGGWLARAYYAAALTIASVIGYSSSLAFALYPRLLSGSSIEDVSVSLKMVMMFAIPMTAGAIVLSDSYLTILKLVYAEARPVLLLLAITVLFASISQVFSTVISGTERVDAKAKIAFRELLRSRLFLLFTLPYIQSAVTLPTTFFILTSVAKTSLEAATYLALIISLAESAMLIVRYIIARKCVIFNFPWKNVAKYIIASAVMVAPLLVIPHPTRLSLTLGFTILGGIIYFAILATIDQETRELTKLILNETKSKLRIRLPARR